MDHGPDGTPPPLEEIAARIASETDTFALTIGLLMDLAMRRNAKRFTRWVMECTPFSAAEAHRLRGVAISYRDLSSKVTSSLPRPSAALTYLFEEASTAPFMSATGTISREDLLVGALVGGDPDQLSPQARHLLDAWSAACASGLPTHPLPADD